MYTEEFTEVHDILATISPETANGAVGAHVTGYVSMADYHRGFVWLNIGTPAAGATIDVSLQQATDTVGTSTKALTTPAGGSKSPTQIVAADLGAYIGIEFRSEEFDISNGFVTLQVTVTVGTDTYTYGLAVFGIISRYEPVGVTDFQEVVH